MLTLILAGLLAVAPSKPVGRGAETYINAADYPAEALRNRQEGTVGFRLDVNDEGRVTGCTITESSRSAVLDSTTCRLLVRRARFDPARDDEGKAVPSTFSSRVIWKLPPPAPPPSPGLIVSTVELLPDGKVENCSSETVGGVPASAGVAVCQSMAAPGFADYLRRNAAAYRTLRFAASISSDDKNYPIDGAGWGTLLVRRGSEVEVGKSGLPIHCKVTASTGGLVGDDVCARLRTIIAAQPDTGETAEKVLHFENAIFGARR